MKQLIEIPLADGSSVIMEVDVPASEGGIVRTAKPGEMVAKVNHTLEAALSRVTPAAEAILSHLSTITQRPDEIEVEFGLKASAESGLIIASGQVEANYSVKLKWTREKPSHGE